MQVGMFQTPFLRPERTAKQVFDWAIRQAVHADKIGFSEYWVGEHATSTGIPNPELVIAAAALQTSRIKFACWRIFCPITTRPLWRSRRPGSVGS
jgi:alkanesulfonate monooxygenase SsuD/methylene tetrahydromethanopterin reductase-like flavin-dependent oxidoreductase (luciferase family)